MHRENWKKYICFVEIHIDTKKKKEKKIKQWNGEHWFQVKGSRLGAGQSDPIVNRGYCQGHGFHLGWWVHGFL